MHTYAYQLVLLFLGYELFKTFKRLGEYLCRRVVLDGVLAQEHIYMRICIDGMVYICIYITIYTPARLCPSWR